MGLPLGEKIQTRASWVILVDGLNEYLPIIDRNFLIYIYYCGRIVSNYWSFWHLWKQLLEK